MGKYPGRERLIGLFAGDIDDLVACNLQNEVEHQRYNHADGERPQGRYREVRNHAVVDVHREQGRCECQEIDQQSGDNHMHIIPPKA